MSALAAFARRSLAFRRQNPGRCVRRSTVKVQAFLGVRLFPMNVSCFCTMLSQTVEYALRATSFKSPATRAARGTRAAKWPTAIEAPRNTREDLGLSPRAAAFSNRGAAPAAGSVWQEPAK